jgi:hypothetical protein
MLRTFSLISILSLVAGCSVASDSASPSPISRDSLTILDSPPADLISPRDHETLHHDLGHLLVGSQPFREKYSVHNPTDSPLRITRSTSLTPCCSAVESIPDGPIPPGGDGFVIIRFKPEGQNGRKRLGFELMTDSQTLPIISLSLEALFFTEWELRVLPSSNTSLSVGRLGQQRWTVITRAVLDNSLDFPTSVNASAQIGVNFAGPETVQVLEAGIVEKSREVEFVLPSSSLPGERRETVTFDWDDGTRKSQALVWRVVSQLQVRPEGFVLSSNGQVIEKFLVIFSDEHKFRILRIEGRDLLECSEFSNVPSLIHILRLKIKPRVDSELGPSDILMVTDHPEDPTIQVTVLYVSQEEDATR